MPHTVPKAPQHRPSALFVHVAVGIISDQHGRVLIGRRPRGTHLQGLWEFPGGKLRAGEDVIGGLQRELREEIGIQVQPGQPLIQIHHQYPDRSVMLDVWRVASWRGQVHSVEGQDLAWVSLDGLKAYSFPEPDIAIVTALRLPALYLISPEPGQDPKAFLSGLEALLDAGVRLFQLRTKVMSVQGLRSLAREVVRLCDRYSSHLMVNTSPGEAVYLDAHGVHLTSARLLQLSERPLPKRYWVAASCHNFTEVEHACRIGADFIVLSPVCPSPSHPRAEPLGWQKFRRLVAGARIPVFALGGLGPGHMTQAWQAGAQGLAMISSVWGARDPGAVVRDCLRQRFLANSANTSGV